jgi:hypothetical protein
MTKRYEITRRENSYVLWEVKPVSSIGFGREVFTPIAERDSYDGVFRIYDEKRVQQ